MLFRIVAKSSIWEPAAEGNKLRLNLSLKAGFMKFLLISGRWIRI